MNGHIAVQVGFLLLGTPIMAGVMMVVAAWTLGQNLESLRETLTAVIGLSTLLGAVAAAFGQRRFTAASQSLHRRKQEVEQLRAEFIQNVTHELRHPLTLVRGYVELLAENQLSQEQQHRLASLALARTTDLMERVESITTFSEIPRGQMCIEPVDVMQLAETALKMMWQKARRARVTLRLDGPTGMPRVPGDPAWLLEALKQLLDNAIKFSPEGGVVSVRLYDTLAEVYVVISDQGIGIPLNQLERVLIPFCQGDGSISRRFGGVGIGLPIVRAVVEAHKGTVRVASEGRDKGATFGLTLPAFEERPWYRLGSHEPVRAWTMRCCD